MSDTYYHPPTGTQHEPPPALLEELRQLPQWVSFRVTPDLNGGKAKKHAYKPGTDILAKSNDPTTWDTFEAAWADVQVGRAQYVGFVPTEDDPYAVIDWDDCFDPETGEFTDLEAEAEFTSCPGYKERSQGTCGFHAVIRGVRPGNRKRIGNFECYDQGQMLIFTFNVADGHDTIRNGQKWLTETYNRRFSPEAPSRQANPEPIIVGDADELSADEIIDRLSNHRDKGAKFRELFSGGWEDKPSNSEARFALMGMCNPYTRQPATIVEVLRQSGLWTDKLEKRPKLVYGEAQRLIDNYPGPRYSRTAGGRSTVDGIDQETGEVVGTPLHTAADSTTVDDMPCDEARVQLKAARQALATKDAQIVAQAKIIRRKAETIRDIEQILASTDLQLGPRVTAIALYLELNVQADKGRKPKEQGYQIPAVWVGRRIGLSTKVANGHLQTLATKKIIERNVVNLTKGEEAIDNDTGEIFTVSVPRKAGFIATQPKAIVTNLTEYKRKDDDVKHGGKGTRDEQVKPAPHCKNHPDAGTVTHTIIECRDCGERVDWQRTEQEPEDIFPPPDLAATGTDGGNPIMGSPITTVSNLDNPKMGTPPDPSSSHPYTPPIDLHRQLQSLGVD